MTDPVLLHEKFTAISERFPGHMAVVAPGGSISYGELEKTASQLAETLRPLLGRAGRVLICLGPGNEFITAMLAVLKTGAAYVPLHRSDPEARIAALSALPGADLMITDRDLKQRLAREIDLPILTLEEMLTETGSTGHGTGHTPGDPAASGFRKTIGDAGAHAYIIHTSGSTGIPKAMGISHAALDNLVAAVDDICPLGPDDRCALWSALHFDVSVYEIWSALLSGAALCIPEDNARFSPEDFLGWMAETGITSAYVPPFMLDAMADGRRLSLRRMLTGVEPIPEPLLCRIKQQIPGLTLINGYGPAEAAVCAALYTVPDTPSRQGRTPIGRPVRNMEIDLVDNRGRKVPRGETGEIIIRGIQVSDGYITPPGQTARVFGNSSGSMAYRTGDLGRELKDGCLVFLGRRDFQIKFRGVRIEPGEIEGLLKQHPDVSQAALVLKQLDSGNQGLVVYVSPRTGALLDTDAVLDDLKKMLPRTMMPSALICLDRLPVTDQGKTDRKALTQRKDIELTDRPRGGAGAFGETEDKIARIWEEVLETPVRSGNENFILLGGDSISAAGIMARINRHFRTDLSLNLLFDYPEFQRFAAHVLDCIPAEAVSTAVDRPTDFTINSPIPLMPDQELIWIFETLYPKTAVYHIPLVFEVSGNLDPDGLEQAVNQTVRHHPALGFSFFMEDGRVFQKWTAPRIRLTLSDLGNQEPNLFFRLDEPGIRKWIGREIKRPFNLAKGPLIRAALLRVDPRQHILCFTIHHLVCDGWSAGLFIQTLSQVYTGRDRDTRDRLLQSPAPGLAAYQDHVLYKKGQLFRQWAGARTFFARYLADLPEQPRPLPEKKFDAAGCPVSLDISLYLKLKAMARQHKTTRFALLLTIFQITLALRTSQTDQVTGVAYAGRDRLESESVTGCLMNTLVVRNKIPFQTSFIRFLGQMKKTLNTIFNYRDIPFHTLREHCRKQGQAHEIFDNLFLMQTMPLGTLSLEGLETRRHPEPPSQANTGLTLELYETPTGARGWIKYHTGRYSEQEAGLISRTFAAVAELVMDCPDERLDTLTEDISESVPDAAQLTEEVEAILSDKSFPLSPMQHGMLMETLRAPQGAGCYVEQVVFDMEEEIDIPRFTAAWNRITGLHNTLRLGFRWQGKEHPEQYLTEAGPIRVEYNDWSGFGDAETQDYLSMFLKADRRLGFSLDHPPAFRVALFKTGPARFTCVWSFHHSIGDGRSMAFILSHLFQAYRNPGCQLPPPPSFRHYIAWLHSRKRARSRQFWRRYLSGFTEPMVFPFRIDDTDRTGSRRQTHAMALTTGHHHLALSPVTCRSISTLCRENGLSVNAFLMGAWAVLLSHYTGKTDVLFGATVSTRHFDPEHQEGTGLYINTLPVRIQVTPDQTLISYIAEIRAQWKEIRTHDHLSLTDIHALSPIQGSSPLSEIYFAYDYQTLDEAVAPHKQDLSCSRIRLLERTPAAIFLTASGTDRLQLSIEYDQRKFSARTTKQILDHFSSFLKSCAQTPDAALNTLPVLTEKEIALIQEKLNTCQGHLPPTSCFHQLFEIQSGINPSAPAITDGHTHYTYDRLNSQANQMARLLMAEGIGPGKKILVLMDQTPDLIAVIIGILKAGACYVPLEPSAPGDRVRFIMTDAGPDFVITTQAHAHKTGTASVRKLLMDRDMERISRQKTTNPEQAVSPRDLAYIIYTSGTTGRPKGVMIEHQALAAFTKTAAQTYDIQAADRILQFAAISFDASAEEIFPTLYAGATLVIKPRELVQTPQAFFAYCRAMELSVIDLPTAYWHMIADEITGLDLPPDLRLVIIGGDAAHPEKVRAWQAAVGDRVRLLNTYGPTETTVAVTWEDLSAAPLETDYVPIGIPFPTVNLSILNHFDQPAPPGVTGELFIGGPQVARGYLNLEAATQKAFIRLDTAGSLRFFKTGDFVKMLPSGQIIFLGRRDRQVKIRGYRVEPGEIEQTLAACGLVLDCALVLTRTPDQEIRMTAFVVPAPGEMPDELLLKSWLREKLPDYMIPAAFILVKSLPRTASGKVDHSLLEQSILSGASGPERRPKAPPVPRRNRVEDRFQAGLGDIWEAILDTGNFSPEDNFFDVGGSSLTAIRLVTAIEKKFAVSLPVLAVFKFPVLKDLAHLLREKDSTTHFSSISAIHPRGDRPPVFFVAGTDEKTTAYRETDLKGHPFYTVTVFAHKTRGKEIIPMDIWEIARRNVKEMLQADPNGPYIIIGFCRYCLVAYEMAAQLNAMGKKVAHLVFLDEFWQKKGRRPAVPRLSLGWGQQIKNLIPRTRKALRTYLHTLNKKRERYYTATGKAVPDTLQASLMESSFWKAYDGYMPLPYPGDLIVLDSLGWQQGSDPRLRTYVQGEVRQITVQARHSDWFETAQIRTIMDAVITAGSRA